MNEINNNPALLPNMSLVFQFSEYVCFLESQYKHLFSLDLQNHEILPNFICTEDIKCGVVLTGLSLVTTVTLHIILNNFIFKQVSVCFHACMHVCVRACMRACVCACVCVWMCTCVRIRVMVEIHEIRYILVPYLVWANLCSSRVLFRGSVGASACLHMKLIWGKW